MILTLLKLTGSEVMQEAKPRGTLPLGTVNSMDPYSLETAQTGE